MKLFNTCTLLTAALVTTAGMSASASTFSGGNILDAGNWSAGFPNGATVGTIDVNGTYNVGNTAAAWSATGFVVIDNGAVITASGDWVHKGLSESTVNNGTINAGDDIFANGSIMTFNAGSTATAVDDFEANGQGILNINGGTHTAGDQLGAQKGSVLNLLGGTVGATGLRTTAGNATIPAGGTINVGGDAIVTSTALSLDASGFIEFSSAWTGSLTATGLSGTDWQTALNGTTATLDGVAIDATVFANNFQLTNNGQTLSLGAVPEPGSLALLGLGGLCVLRRRRG